MQYKPRHFHFQIKHWIDKKALGKDTKCMFFLPVAVI